MVDVEDEPNLEFAVQRLTDTEQEIIAQVLARDEEVRELEEMRLSRLNFELLELREKGVPEGMEDEFGRVCMRCRTPLGVLINSGSLCERCSKRICRDCRLPYNNAWLCVVCVKEREVKAESGAWFYDKFTKKGKRVYGSALLKRFFRRVKYKDKPYERNQGKAGLPEITTVDVIPSAEVRPLFTKAATGNKESVVEEEKKEEAEEFHAKLRNGSVEDSRVEPAMVIIDAQERKDSFLSDTGSLESDFASSNVTAGEILLGLKFLEKEKRLEVQVHRVRDLPPADPRKHTTDPYVKVYLLPDKSKGSKRKTKIKKHSLNPEFDEILTYKLSYEDLLTRKVWVGVCHHDPLGRNSLLGEMQIIIDAYIQSGFSLEDPIPQWYTLTKRTMTRAELKDVGDIRLSLKYVPPGSVPGDNRKSKTDDPASGTLLVKVVSAKNLKSEREESQMNAYVKLELLGEGQHKSKHSEFKTAVKSGTLHPQWDQEFAFDNVSWNGLHKRVLEVFVYDGDSSIRSDYIGVTRIGLGKTDNEWDDPFGPEVAIWKTMLDSPNEWNSVTIPLRSSGLSVKMDTSAPAVHVKRVQEDTLLSKEYKTGSMGSLDDVGSLKKKTLMKHADQLSLSSFGSMLSIYSDAGGHGGLQITGDVLFSIKYDDIAGVFEVHVIKAKNIAIANKRTQKSDPYVKTYLLPDKSKNSKKKSAVRRRTLNPEWNENIKYKIGKDDLMKRTLQLSLWNYDKFGQNDFLGEVQVQIQKYVKSGHVLSDAEPVWYTLQDAAPISIGQPGFQGDLTLAVKYDSDNKKLLVDIREAKGLPSADPNTKPHSFVKGYLLPDKTRLTKRKTKVVKSLDPKWSEKFEYGSVIPEDLQSCVLELTVWDQEKKENVFLGGTRIGLKSGDEAWHDCMGKEVQLWQAVIDHPNIWNEYVVPLRDSMTSRKGMDVPLPSVDTPSPLLFPDAKIETGMPVIRLGLVYQQGDTVETLSTYEESEGKSLLKVHLKEARYLPLREDGQLPNTFCKCFVTGKRKSAKKKTEIYLRASEPLWDAELAFDGIPFEDLENRGFEVQVWDDVEGKTPAQIGFVRLGLGQLRAEWDDSVEKEIALWQSMLQKLNEWSYMFLPLREPEKIASRSFSRPDSTEQSVTSEIRKDIDLMIDSHIETETAATSKQSNGEIKSPKALALEAMGDSASNVITILKTQNQPTRRDREIERTQHAAAAATMEVPVNSSYDSGADLSLSPIQEEAEETESLAGDQRVPFYQTPPMQPVMNKAEEFRPRLGSPVLPNVVITTPHDDVKPGEPPIKGKPIPEYQWDEEDEDTKVGGKKSKKEKKEEKKKTKLMKRPGFGSQDSLGSIQSARSEDGVYGRVAVRGDLQLGLQYDYGNGTLEVHVFQARNLAAVDTRNSTSDSYVKTYLMPDKTKATKRKTRVKKNTLDPEWNQIIEYKVTVPDLRTRVLVVQVWNRDRLSRNDFLGEIQFQFEELIDQRKLGHADPVWHPLCEKAPLLEPARYKGNLKVLLMFEDPDLKAQRSESDKKDKDKDGEKKKKKKAKSKSKLIVNIVDATDLPAGDLDGYSDPYCKLQLLPLKGKTKRKTHTIRHTLNPVWDYRTEYDVDYEDLAELGLEITVWDWDRGSKDDFLGCLRLNLGERNSGWDDAEGLELEAWKALMNKPNRLHEFNFVLRSVRDNQTDN